MNTYENTVLKHLCYRLSKSLDNFSGMTFMNSKIFPSQNVCGSANDTDDSDEALVNILILINPLLYKCFDINKSFAL